MKSGNFSRFRSLLPRPPLSMYDWAYEHVRIPSGPHAGARLSRVAQPVSDLVLRELSGARRFVLVAPAQSGKSLIGWAIPVLYWAVERASPVAMGLPARQYAVERWDTLLEPILRGDPLLSAALTGARRCGLSTDGTGHARLGTGACLYPLTGHGKDKSRAAVTARALCASETDGYADMRASSAEADPITQMRARLLAYGDHAHEYYECTVSTEQGFIWREYQASTRGVVEHRCPYCGAWVRLNRENLLGWQDAENETQAAELAHYACPACGARWSERDRRESLLAARVIHEQPGAATVGLRYTAAQNMLLPPSYVAREEWLAMKENSESRRRRLAQQMWAEPPPPPPDAIIEINFSNTDQRYLPRGVVPTGCERVYVGVDVGRHALHWVAAAPRQDGGLHIVAYGVHRSRAAEHVPDAEAVYAGLRRLSLALAPGWIREGDGVMIPPRAVFVDAGWSPRAVRQACQQLGWVPCMGRSATLYKPPPERMGRARPRMGDGWYVRPREGVVHDTDASKDALRDLAKSGRISLFGDPREHETFLQHLAAEVRHELPSGVAVYRHIETRENHWLDAAALAVLSWRVDDPAHTDPVLRVRMQEAMAAAAAEADTAVEIEKKIPNPDARPPRSRPLVRRVVRSGGGWVP